VQKKPKPQEFPQNKFNIPSKKLPNSLAQRVCNGLWKKIISSIEKRNLKTLLDKIEPIYKQKGVLCLPHPFVENLDTFASKSVRKGMCNYIFFYDSKGQNKWILCQCTSFVDAIISTTYSGKHKSSVADDTILGSLRKIMREEVKNSSNHLSKKAKFAGYLLDQTRPYHHFYDQLKWFIYLQDSKPVLSEKSFFCPRNPSKRSYIQNTISTNVTVFPNVIGSNQLGMKLDKYTEKMERTVQKDSLGKLPTRIWKKIKGNTKSLFGKKNLTLWFGISGQKRIWVEQKDFLPELVEQLSLWYSSFVFIIDGFTEYEDSNHNPLRGSKATPVSQDLEVINSIREKLVCYSNVSIVSVVGQTYREKIQKCQSADFFIANAGAGQLVPHRFCRKPGILHSNEKHCVFPTGINNTSVQLVDKSLVKDVGNLFTKSKQNRQAGSGLISYSINPQIVIDMALQMLKLD
jgi:hypothetical protein